MSFETRNRSRRAFFALAGFALVAGLGAGQAFAQAGGGGGGGGGAGGAGGTPISVSTEPLVAAAPPRGRGGRGGHVQARDEQCAPRAGQVCDSGRILRYN